MNKNNNYNGSYNQFINLFLLIIICTSFFLISCGEKTEYQQRLETEQSKDIRVDSLFLGYYFGMNSSEFFDHSWDLNRREIVTGQQRIHYKIDELKSPASMAFYPLFRYDKIYKYPIEVHYDGWAPWNKDLFSDTLMVDIVHLFEQKYGSNFFKSIHPESQKEAFIDIQGNRRIAVFRKDDRIVNIEFLDLTTVENP